MGAEDSLKTPADMRSALQQTFSDRSSWWLHHIDRCVLPKGNSMDTKTALGAPVTVAPASVEITTPAKPTPPSSAKPALAPVTESEAS